MIRVLVADDDQLMQAGLIELLGADSTIEVVGRATTGAEAVRLTESLAPDVVLMDVRMPGGDGISATTEITRRGSASRVLVLTTFDDDEYVFGAIDAGASGFMLKRAKPEDLLAAVHVIADGEALLAPAITRRVIDRVAQTSPPKIDDQAINTLTPRERDVLDLLVRGLSNREIAEELYVEESTVRTHVKRVLMKLDLPDRVHVVIYAYQAGIAD